MARYYRNKSCVHSCEGVWVDEGALWERKNELMVLVDEDQYVTCDFVQDVFEPETR